MGHTDSRQTQKQPPRRLFLCPVFVLLAATLLEAIDTLEVSCVAGLEREGGDSRSTARTFPATGEARFLARDRDGTATEVIAGGWFASNFRKVWDVWRFGC